MAIFEAEKIERALVVIWDFLSIYDEPVQADAIFAFGSSLITTPKHAAYLYHNGYAPVIVISGSSGPLSRVVFGRPEVDVFRETCIREGVPEEAIICEAQATHTGENIQFGMKALRDAGHQAKHVLAVSWPYHMRRVDATFEKLEPDISVTCCPPPGEMEEFVRISRERFALRLAGEADRISDYGAKGMMAFREVPPSVVEAVKTIRQSIPASAGVFMK
jgi:uncharacterized SAM-binding protein YcdF (DUF218 family)